MSTKLHPHTARRRTMPAYFLGRPVHVYVERYARTGTPQALPRAA